MRGHSLTMLFVTMLALALTACNGAATAPPPTPAPDAAAIVEQTREAMLTLEHYRATVALELSGPGGGEVTMQVALRGSPVADSAGQELRFKGEVTSSTLPSLPVGTVAVVGPTNLLYDPVQNVAVEGSAGVGGSELFNLFLGSQVRVVTLLQPALADATLAGEETIGAYQTWKLTLAPKAAVAVAAMLGENATATVWVDQASNLPVQFQYSDNEVGLSWTASEVDATTPVADADLSFTPPADAQVVGPDELGQSQTVASVDEAVAAAGFTPLQPAYLPAGLPVAPSSVGVRQTSLGAIVQLGYAIQAEAGTAPSFPGIEDVTPLITQGITISALNGPVNLPANPPTGAIVSETTVRGQPAVEVVLGDRQASLSWQEGEVFYTIRGNGFGIDELRKVAESMA